MLPSCLTLYTLGAALIDKIIVKSMIIFIVFLLLTYIFVQTMKGLKVLPNQLYFRFRLTMPDHGLPNKK